MAEPHIESDRRGFPLSSVILVTTAVACSLACVDLANIGPTFRVGSDVAQVIGVAMIAGTAIGGFIGRRRRARRGRGFLLGMASGCIAGILLGLILVAPGNPLQVVAAGGVLIGTSVGVRWNTP